jgi:hypothetical protein
LFFKIFFTWKYIKIIYIFYVLKFIFDINTQKIKNKNIKKNEAKKNLKFFRNTNQTAIPNTLIIQKKMQFRSPFKIKYKQT